MKRVFYRYWIFSFIFILLLIFPTVSFPILKNILPSEKDGLIENRNLNQLEITFQKFGANFENYYQDNFPFRNSLIPLYNKYYNIIYNIYFFENINNDEEWDDIEEYKINNYEIANEIEEREEEITNDFDKIEQVAAEPVGNVRNIQREAEVDIYERLMNMLVEADNYFNSLNKKIIFQVCPRKRYISNFTTGITPLDSFSNRIDTNTSVSFSYPKNKYLEYESDYMTFDEYNSHHNFLGAYISWQEIQKKAGIEIIDINDVDIYEFEIDVRRVITTPFDITCCYPYNQDLPAVRKTEPLTSINYDIAYRPEVEIETLHNSHCIWLEFKSSNANGQTLFLTGDSFLETQIQYAIKDFEFSNISHLYNFDAGSRNRSYRERIKNYIESADVIVIVIGENNLWNNNLEENPSLEHRLSLILELAKEIYRDEL